MNTVNIRSGKRGFHLKVNGFWISQGFTNDIKAIQNTMDVVPCGATEWVSVRAIRDFWKKYRAIILDSLNRPHVSYNGSLILRSKLFGK